MSASLRPGSDVYSLGNPASITNATGHAPGDIIVIVASYFDSPTATVTVSGFTSFLKIIDSSSADTLQEWFWKLDSGSEPASYSYTHSNFTDFVCFAMTGCDIANPIGVTANAHAFSSSGTPLVIPSAAVPLANSFLMAVFNARDFPATTPYPITKISQRGDATFVLMGESVTAGATGSKTIQVTGTGTTCCGGMVAFGPPAESPNLFFGSGTTQ